MTDIKQHKHSFNTEYGDGFKQEKCWDCKEVNKPKENIATLQCPACKEWYEDLDFNDNSFYANILDAQICQGCYESDQEHRSCIVRFNGEKEAVYFGDYMAWTDDGDEPPQWFWDMFTERKYKATDGWRGYYDTKFKGLKSLADGWVTGWPDETVKHKNLTYKLNDFLQDADCPKYLYWLFEPTSNVFSTASEILVEENDADEVTKWLEKNKFSIESLQEAFG